MVSDCKATELCLLFMLGNAKAAPGITHAKQHGYALFERTQSLIGLYSYAIELVNTILRARIQLFIP